MKKRRQPTNPHLLKHAREMRQEDTRAEQHAWKLLRDRRMLGLKFRRQVPIGSYIVDFYCDVLRLVVELDGAVHEEPNQARNDEVRDIHLKELGFQIVRVPKTWF